MFLRTIAYSVCILAITIPALPFSFFTRKTHPVTIMVNPAGDAHHVGRKIGYSFERSVTLLCAEQLKKTVEQQYPNVRVVLTRLPGEIEQPLQHANFANRLQADLYISIHFHQEQNAKPHWDIYTFSYGNDFMTSSPSILYTYDKAHLINKKTTHRWATLIKQTVSQEPYAQHYTINGVYTIPCKPLIGIKAAALAYEIGLKHPDDWTQAVEGLVASLAPIIRECQTQ